MSRNEALGVLTAKKEEALWPFCQDFLLWADLCGSVEAEEESGKYSLWPVFKVAVVFPRPDAFFHLLHPLVNINA